MVSVSCDYNGGWNKYVCHGPAAVLFSVRPERPFFPPSNNSFSRSQISRQTFFLAPKAWYDNIFPGSKFGMVGSLAAGQGKLYLNGPAVFCSECRSC